MAKNETLTTIESRFLHRLHKFPEDATEGFVVQAFENRKKILDLHWGNTYDYYDLASLTKIIFSIHELMRLFDEQKFKLSDKLNKFLPWLVSDATIEQVLTHTAGFLWWHPFFKDINPELSNEFKRIRLKEMLREHTSKNQTTVQAVYSDVDFLLLGFLIEELRNRSLIDCWSALKELGNHGEMHFITKPMKTSKYAPTENCGWRKRQLQGEVHDENTFALGGVSSHAGLFGSATDVSKWGRSLFQKLLHNRGEFGVSQKTLRLFTTRAMPVSQGDWSLGFMMPTSGQASCGKYYSENSFGHTGFTGTSLWLDPKTERLTTLLSNRIYPSRENKLFVTQRSNIHNWIWSPFDEEAP